MRIVKWLFWGVVLSGIMACQKSSEYVLCGKITVVQNVAEYKLTLQGVDTVLQIRPDTNNNFRVSLPEGIPFFNLEGIVMKKDRSVWQFTSPLCLESGGTLKLNLELGDGKEKIDTEDKTNRVIQELRICCNQKMKELWDAPPCVGELENWIDAHIRRIKEIKAKEQYMPAVAEYIETWSQMEYLKFFKGVQYLFPNDDSFCMPERLIENLPDISETLDKPYWKLFQNSAMNIMFYLQDCEEEPEGQLKLLNERFQTQTIREEISGQIIAFFLKRYPYSVENLERIRTLCAGRTDAEDIIKQFRGKEFSTPGVPALNVAFEDAGGNLHKISDFKGKYVYLDIWASWCGPCCAEVPALQKLEKELNNPQVVFVSISVDKNKKQWQEKMKQLGMTGNQWIITDEEFLEKMNIKTIPHFLLYNKESKLMEYRAANPSKSILWHQLERLR